MDLAAWIFIVEFVLTLVPTALNFFSDINLPVIHDIEELNTAQ